MKKKIKVFAMFCAVAAAGLMVGCGSQGEPVAKISAINGQVSARMAKAPDFAAIEAEQQLMSGDAIKTGDESSVDMELISDKSQIRLNSNTFLEIRNFSEKELKQMSGIAIYKITPQNRQLKIQTPQVMATVLGTTLRIDVSDEETVVRVEKGKVGFSKKAGHEVLIEGGMKYSSKSSLDQAEPIDPFELEKAFHGDNLKPIINPR